SGDAAIRAERISSTMDSWSGCDIGAHPLFELLQRPAEPGRARRRRDAEDAGGRLDLQVEQDAQGDHLALAGRQRRERTLELRREPPEEAVLDLVRELGGVRMLASSPPLLGAEVVESGGARDAAQPRLRAPPAWIEASPLAQRPLERLGGQLLGRLSVSRH